MNKTVENILVGGAVLFTSNDPEAAMDHLKDLGHR